jgi:hypothetical protein
VLTATVAADTLPVRGAFVPAAEFDPRALPTVMRKCWDVALGRL